MPDPSPCFVPVPRYLQIKHCVHQNWNWNNSFILHYWLQTILIGGDMNSSYDMIRTIAMNLVWFMGLRVISYLVWLPGPNPSLIAPSSPAPAGLHSYYFIWVRTADRLRLFTPLLSNDGVGEGGKMHTIALCIFIYVSFWTVCFVYKASVHKAHVCLINVLQILQRMLKENRN